MADLGVGIRLSDDRDTATIEFIVDGRPTEPVQLDFDQLTDLIAVLGEARMRMLKDRHMVSLEGQEVRTIDQPSWYIQVARIDGSLLAFNHPCFGPVGFAIPRSEVAEMVRILNGHLAMPVHQTERRN